MAASEDRAIVANEITILLRQLEQVSNLLSSQTRDLGGIDADIKSLNKIIDDIKKSISELFNSRNQIDKDCPILRNKIEAKIKDANSSITSIDNKMSSLARLSDLNSMDSRVSSVEGYIKNDLDEKSEKEKEERDNKKSKKGMFLDAAKIIIQMATAAVVAYLTIKFGK